MIIIVLYHLTLFFANTAAFPFFFKIGFPSSVGYFFKPSNGLVSCFCVPDTFWSRSEPQLLLFSSNPIRFFNASSSLSSR